MENKVPFQAVCIGRIKSTFKWFLCLFFRWQWSLCINHSDTYNMFAFFSGAYIFVKCCLPFSSFILKIPNGKPCITFLLVNSRLWREINKTCCSPLMVFGDHVRMEWWMAEEQAQQWGKMSWTGNRGSTRLMMLVVIICRCEWSEINHWGVRLEWHEVRKGNDQIGGNADELYETFTEVDQPSWSKGK